MQSTLRVSIWLNLILMGAVIVLLICRHREAAVLAPGASAAKPVVRTAAALARPAPMPVMPKPFSWRQLESTNDYRAYVANLRGVGCPEATIRDIVQGDVERTFARERDQLSLGVAGSGPWSGANEQQLVANLLAKPSVTAEADAPMENAASPARSGNDEAADSSSQSGNAVAPAYPLFLQNVNWSALGFDAGQQATIAQVRQQFLDAVNGANQNASGQPTSGSGAAQASTPAQRWQMALDNADDTLRGLLGADAYNAYELQQYMNWFQPQAQANVGGGNLFINPAAFTSN